MNCLWIGLGLVLVLTGLPQSLQAKESASEDLAYSTGVMAYVWGYPLVQAAHIRMITTRPDLPPGTPRKATDFGAPLGQVFYRTTLAGPEYRIGVGPNNDTVYSLAWVDVKQEPWILLAPDFGKRYYTFTIYDSFSGGEASPGTRTHGGQMPPIAIVGPDWKGTLPSGVEAVHIPTRYGLVAGRVLVDGESDLKNVIPLQKKIKIVSLSEYLHPGKGEQSSPQQRLLDDPKQDVPKDLVFFEELGQILKDQPPAPHERGLLGFFKNIGLSTEKGFDYRSLDEATIRGLQRAIVDGTEIVKEKSLNLGKNVNGWTSNFHGSRFGDDYLLRAGVAKDQIYVSIPEEALYPIARVDGEGRPLTGSHRYVLKFPAKQLPPVKAFWSVTLYNDKGFMIHNPIERYSIGDRTKGLQYNADGSLEICIQHEPPAGKKKANWLPAPAGDFYLMMRLYIPGKSALDGSWQPAPIKQVIP